MTTAISFDASTPRFALPNLFAGQAQKEFYVNEALGRLDALLHTAIEGEGANPPATPAEGACWLIIGPATGDWSGREGQIAAWQAGGWHFLPPQPGMRIVDISTGGTLYFDGSWQRLVAPTNPSGGSVIDTEARQAISAMIVALQDAGLFPAS